MTNAECRVQKAERRLSAPCILRSAFILLLSVLPLQAAAPITQLPGVVDADSYKHTPHKAAAPAAPIPDSLKKTYDLITALNQVSQEELTEQSGPPVQALDGLREEDGPDFAKLKVLLARADVRKSLNAGTKGMLADVVSGRWDAFTLAGNLWLAALNSTNTDISDEAKRRLPQFIQKAHLPPLIALLKVPGPNVRAYEILQDVTGQKLDPNPNKWLAWWKKGGSKVDLAGHMLNLSRQQLRQTQIQPVDGASFWYAPEEISRTDRPYNSRSTAEQNAIGRWSDGARADIKHYVEQWDATKPFFDRIVHQPDVRIAGYLKTLVSDPGMGEYVSVVLAWRGDTSAFKIIEESTAQTPTVGRWLALGTLGHKPALQSLLKMVEAQKSPLSYGLMDAELRGYAAKLPPLGVISAEQAFELLVHERFGLVSAVSASEKRKALKKARRWLEENYDTLVLDHKRGYYYVPIH